MRKRDSKSRWIPLILLSIGISLLVLAAFLLWPLIRQKPAQVSLPESLAAHAQAQALYGQEAIQAVDDLHGRGFELRDAAVGVYGTQGQVVLWVSAAADETGCERLRLDMRDKIAQTQTPFDPLGSEMINDRRVEVLQGLGQMHYYFCAGELLVWLQADADLAQQALGESMAFYP